MDAGEPEAARLPPSLEGMSAATAAALKRLEKNLREAERLVVARERGDAMSADEHAKAESREVLRAQIGLPKAPDTPAAVGGSSAAQSSGAAVASATSTQPAAACFAASCNDAATALQSLPREPETCTITRATHFGLS